MIYIGIGIGCLLCIFLFIIWMHLENNHFRIEHYEVESEKLPAAFHGNKIVFITDLHNHSFGKNNGRLLAAIDKEKPDYVMTAGDLLIKGETFATETALNLLENLCQKYPVYYAPGNHEKRLGELEGTKNKFWKEYIAKAKKMGVNYLSNESVILKKGNQSISVSGIDIDRIYYKKGMHRPKLEKKEMEMFMPECKKETYQILLAHNPEYFETYAEWGADLVLSGHFHGGIMILPFIGGVVAPSYQLFPKYDFGKFQSGNSTMILSRGLAVHSIKIRIFNVPELSVITLKQK